MQISRFISAYVTGVEYLTLLLKNSDLGDWETVPLEIVNVSVGIGKESIYRTLCKMGKKALQISIWF